MTPEPPPTFNGGWDMIISQDEAWHPAVQRFCAVLERRVCQIVAETDRLSDEGQQLSSTMKRRLLCMALSVCSETS